MIFARNCLAPAYQHSQGRVFGLGVTLQCRLCLRTGQQCSRATSADLSYVSAIQIHMAVMASPAFPYISAASRSCTSVSSAVNRRHGHHSFRHHIICSKLILGTAGPCYCPFLAVTRTRGPGCLRSCCRCREPISSTAATPPPPTRLYRKKNMDFPLCLGLSDPTMCPDAPEVSLACYGTLLLSLSDSVVRYTSRKRNAAWRCRPRAFTKRRIRRCQRTTTSSRGHYLGRRAAPWMSEHNLDRGR